MPRKRSDLVRDGSPLPESTYHVATEIRTSCVWNATCVLCFLMAAASGSCAAFYFGEDVSRWLQAKRGVCFTSSCLRLADQIVGTVDMGTDPCDDFYLFSCGAYNHTGTSLPTGHPPDQLLRRVRTLMKHWALEYRTPTQLQVSASLYQGCVAVARDQVRGVRHLLHFMRKHRIDVFKHEPSADPLDVILKLAVRYDIKTLFELAVENRLLVVRRRRDLADWAVRRLALIKNHTYDEYLGSTFALLGITTRVVITFMVGSVWHTEDIVLRLFSRMKKHDGALVFFNFTERGVLDRPEWRSHLGHVWNRVAVKGAPVAAFLNRIFRDMTSLAIAQYVSWEVVRQLGPFADFRLRAPYESDAYTEDRCFRAVYEVAGLAPLAVVMAQDVGTDTVLAAATFLETLLQDVGATDVTLRLLDPKRLLGETLRGAYAPTISGVEDGESDSFLTSYVRALMTSRQRELDGLDSPDPALSTEDVLSYRAVVEGDRLTVPTSLLTWPWFSRDFPRSLNYAGLGFVVLEALVRSGFKLDIQHEHTVGITAVKPVWTPTAGCNDTSGPGGRALEALLQVLNLRGRERNPLRLPGELEALNENQLLFLAFCFRGCARNDTSSDTCNDVLRRMWHFGNTFQCMPGDYMHPKALSGCAVKPEIGARSLFTGEIVRNAARKISTMMFSNDTLDRLKLLFQYPKRRR
ncbi:neprilysin-1-like isoform X2 [Dermacentor albipictus]|uniref:neprilysin-1-like isoform X2 n=1 Tax=Dermacentor albipictus TaxID=60249 RepID=UPI0038FCA6CB